MQKQNPPIRQASYARPSHAHAKSILVKMKLKSKFCNNNDKSNIEQAPTAPKQPCAALSAQTFLVLLWVGLEEAGNAKLDAPTE